MWKITSKSANHIYFKTDNSVIALPKDLVAFIENSAINKMFDEEQEKKRLRVR